MRRRHNDTPNVFTAGHPAAGPDLSTVRPIIYIQSIDAQSRRRDYNAHTCIDAVLRQTICENQTNRRRKENSSAQ